ncbi:MAG: preprotein translocase subunit SecG [Thermodesulfobacteriota bacterium]
MTTLLTVIHVVVCFFLIAIVLLQHGKGADMGAAFGGASQTVFGTEGPLPLLNKITTGAAIIFMITSITLAYLSTRAGDASVMKDAPAATEQQVAPTPIPLPSSGAGNPAEGQPAPSK